MYKTWRKLPDGPRKFSATAMAHFFLTPRAAGSCLNAICTAPVSCWMLMIDKYLVDRANVVVGRDGSGDDLPLCLKPAPGIACSCAVHSRRVCKLAWTLHSPEQAFRLRTCCQLMHCDCRCASTMSKRAGSSKTHLCMLRSICSGCNHV